MFFFLCGQEQFFFTFFHRTRSGNRSLMRVLYVVFCSSLCANGVGGMELDLGGRRRPRNKIGSVIGSVGREGFLFSCGGIGVVGHRGGTRDVRLPSWWEGDKNFPKTGVCQGAHVCSLDASLIVLVTCYDLNTWAEKILGAAQSRRESQDKMFNS